MLAMVEAEELSVDETGGYVEEWDGGYPVEMDGKFAVQEGGKTEVKDVE
jgi:hypothetical protein